MKLTVLSYWGGFIKSRRQIGGVRDAFRSFAEREWDLVLAMEKPPANKAWQGEIAGFGNKIVYVPRAKKNFDWKCIVRTYRLCKAVKCDVFHCHNIHTSPLIGAALAGVPVRIWSKRSMNEGFEKGSRSFLRDKVSISTRLSCLLSTRVLAVSDAVRNELAQLKIPTHNIMTFNNPITSLNFNKMDRQQARAELGFHESDVVVVTVGHSVPVKGWDVLLNAFREMAESVERMKLLFVGSCAAPHEKDHFAQMTRFVSDSGLTHRVNFVGRVEDVTRELRAGDIFIMPSRSEGNSNALIEALCVGLPCISTRVGASEKLVEHGVNGFLVDREDYKEMARYLLMLGADPNLRKKMASMSKIPAWLPSPEEYQNSLLSLYESLANRKGRRGKHQSRSAEIKIQNPS